MSSGRLKASTNRVRTSVALQQSSIWTKTIGLEENPQAGSNAAVEAHINAPSHGAGRAARRAAAAQAVMQTGAFDTDVTSYESLLNIARSQGAVGSQNRGACRICGQLGHLTKQCKNHLSVHFDAQAAGTAAAGAGLLAGDEEEEQSSGLSDLIRDGSGSGSDSSTRERKEKKEKRKRKLEKSKKSKGKEKHKKKKHKKDKKSSKE